MYISAPGVKYWFYICCITLIANWHKHIPNNGLSSFRNELLSVYSIGGLLQKSLPKWFFHSYPQWSPFNQYINVAGADLGNYGWGGRVCVNKGKALDRGTKCRAGGGYGRGVSPLPIWKKIKIRDCLDVFWSTPNSTLLCVFSILKEQIFDILLSLTYIVMLQMVNATV